MMNYKNSSFSGPNLARSACWPIGHCLWRYRQWFLFPAFFLAFQATVSAQHKLISYDRQEVPQFTDAANGGFTLQEGSPAIDAGDNAAWTATGLMTDAAGNTRPVSTVDMGAFERQQTSCPTGNILYVAATATGANDGTSWTDAFTDLQNALNCTGITQIWVAAGTYYPTSGTDRNATFQLKNGLALYGGFDGTETMRSERDWENNETILSGDIGTVGDNSDNSYTVVTGSGTDATALLDGFTITAGNANGGGFPNNFGGGMFNENGSPILANCTFSRNSASGGGGMYNTGSSPSLTNCTFSRNSASNGGGMFNDDSSPSLTNCTFSGNSDGNIGGGIYNQGSSPTITNCTFSGNSASSIGGGMANFSSSPTITNCTFSGNSASFGGGMANFSSSPTVKNTIIWNNRANGVTNTASASISNSGLSPNIAYSLIANSGGSASWIGTIGTDGGGNIDADPQFTDAANGGFTLQEGSPAIDAGDNAAWTATGLMTDAAGNTRPVGTVDMGAFERQQASCPTGNILYVAATATGANDGTSWTDAFTDLQNALNSTCPGITQIWVAAGTYYPTSGTDRNATFQLKDGLALYGGFDGTETMLGQRDFVANATILSGDLKQDDSSSIPLADLTSDASRSDNAYSVVTGSGTDATAVLDGFTITGGNADVAPGFLTPNNTGGGMYNNAGSPTVSNCAFSGNSAGGGGGMYNNAGSPTVTNCSFSENSATSGGGMYDNAGSPTITNCTFSGNSASNGGGMYNAFSYLKVTNCTFSGNSAVSSIGGGMYNVAGSPTVSNCTFSGNSASSGGGMLNTSNSSPTVTNCTFSGNSANGGGGGGMSNSGNSPTVTNCTFSGNSASFGGGMFNSGDSPTVTNCTFSGNSAGSFGGGMYNLQSSPTVTNSIIWNNSAGGSTTAVFASVFNDSSTPAFIYSLIANSGGSGSWLGAIGTDGGGNIDANPLFAAPLVPGLGTGGDYRLQACSPAINAGSNAAVPMGITTDLDGNPRFLNDGKVDMGAYEFQSMAVCLALSGNILWEHERVANPTPVPDATVTLSGDDAGSESTDLLGGYAIPSFGGSSLTLTPTKTGNAYEGVDAADVTRIQQHVTFIAPFDDGYKVIAADVNQSNSVTGLDAAVLFHAINGNPSAQTIFETPSWRFVKAMHTFMDENEPWPFPKDISLTDVMDDMVDQDFVGVKMGDVNGTWATTLELLAPPLNWAVPDATLKAGQTLRVPFRATGLPDVAAWQFALRFDTDYLRFERALSTAAFPLKDENFGAWQAERGELRSVFAVPQGLVLPKGEVIFELEFQVVRGGLSLSEALRLDDEILDGLVYNTALRGGAVALTFAAVETRRIASLPLPGEHAPGFTIQQNMPNPFSNETLIRFQLPEAGEAVFSVHDVQGRLLYEQRGFFDAGLHEVRLDAELLGATGVLSYTLRCGAHSATRRMVVVR